MRRFFQVLLTLLKKKLSNCYVTGHPRMAHDQWYPMPCLEWSAEEVEWEQGNGPKGPMSCRTRVNSQTSSEGKFEGWFDHLEPMRHLGADLGGPRAHMRSEMRSEKFEGPEMPRGDGRTYILTDRWTGIWKFTRVLQAIGPLEPSPKRLMMLLLHGNVVTLIIHGEVKCHDII